MSMQRYASDLESAYLSQGWEVTVKRPSAALSSRIGYGPLRKLIAYVEALIIFPVAVASRSPRAQLLHVSDHSNALWLLGPAAWRFRRAIVTCHDLFAVRAALGEIPEHSTRATGRLYQALVRAGMTQADLIECDSDVTRSDVERLIPRADCVTIHLPVARTAQPNPTSSHEGNYVMVVSPGGWRKRREHAVAVWERLRQSEASSPLSLVVVGPELEPHELSATAQPDQIQVVNGVSDEELHSLYASALAVLQVSRYEGFGWPIVEAHVNGTPALCTDGAVFREIAGDGGIFLSDDLDSVDWDAVLKQLRLAASRDRALENARRFTPKQFARKVDDVAAQLIESKDA